MCESGDYKVEEYVIEEQIMSKTDGGLDALMM